MFRHLVRVSTGPESWVLDDVESPAAFDTRRTILARCLNREGLQKDGGARGTGGAGPDGRRPLFWPGGQSDARGTSRSRGPGAGCPRKRASGALLARAPAPVGSLAGVGRRAPRSRARPSGPLRAAGVGCRSGLRRRRLASKGRRLANARPPIFASLTRLVEARFCVAYPPCASASFVRKGNLVCRAVRNYTSLFVIPSVR